MREHKYRAWDPTKKIMYSAAELGQDQETLSVDGRGFVNVNGVDTRLSQFHTHLLPLEYTGLKDKNGKEIYEGDILGIFNPVVEGSCWEIVWHEFGWQILLHGMKDIPNYYVNVGKHLEEHEIIGNIYENPELSKEENQ